MYKSRKLVKPRKVARPRRRSNPLAVRINSIHKSGFVPLEHLLSAYLNHRGADPCPADDLPLQLESPLSATINQRRPIAEREVVDPCEAPLWDTVNHY